MAGEKRTQEQEDTMLSQTTILLDIEGTTTSISFVKEVLFPYVRDNLKKYITDGWTRDDFKEDYKKLKEQAKKDEDDKVEGFVPITGNNVEEEQESLMKNILWQMDNDRKTTSLKQLQGHMFSEAYKTGILKGRVYDDVPKSLELWVNNGKKIYVYSSGSVELQKLHFGHSEHGDLLKYFSGFFDTEIGAKQECNSYKNILTKLGEKANNVIFLTDVVKEAAAAKEAGILPIIVIREGNVALTDEEAIAYTTVKSFLDVTFQTSNKRQKLNPTELEKKDESVNPNSSSEPMDTSEDVEIPDDNTKEKDNTETKSPQLEQEIKVKADDETNQTILKDENETMKDVKDIKDTTVTSAKSEEKEQSVTTKPPETPTKVVGATSISDDAMVVATKSESVSKSETDDNKKCTKSETVVQNETTTNTVKDNKTREEGGVSEKSAETETKEEGSSSSTTSRQQNSSTTEATNSAEEETISKTTITTTTTTTTTTPQVSSKVENPPLSSDATKSDDVITTAKINKEEDTKIEKENKTNDTNKKESKEEQEKSNVVAAATAAAEKCKDGDAKVENQEESKNRETKENVEVKASLPPKSEKQSESVESIEKESSSSSKESAKEETVVSDEVMKDKSTVESEKKKLNGTTQNGGDDVPVSDENLHRNGLNEGSSSDKITLTTTTTTTTTTTSEEKPAQNGEPPESSTDTSAESIKVKKVVDSAVADGAGEPDVVPPVVVAATS
ncbi:PREDICTED: enolase-phosphatase E1-like [Polistes dominula]|uniref:Enolase-phosphatase E1-like n=1 Tax=Polistes dominula TaxID=743375 RepID=A0ABM1J7F7_POLDO|nr:PREDICTED: enolase-phosphatase E1-like [Polistes dominula]